MSADSEAEQPHCPHCLRYTVVDGVCTHCHVQIDAPKVWCRRCGKNERIGDVCLSCGPLGGWCPKCGSEDVRGERTIVAKLRCFSCGEFMERTDQRPRLRWKVTYGVQEQIPGREAHGNVTVGMRAPQGFNLELEVEAATASQALAFTRHRPEKVAKAMDTVLDAVQEAKGS